MKTVRTTIEEEEIILEVFYEYEESDAGDIWVPPSGGYLSVYEIRHQGKDIINIVDPKFIERLENKLYEEEISHQPS